MSKDHPQKKYLKSWTKGQSGNPAGRPKGCQSKTTTRFKQALNDLLETSSEDMLAWLSEIDDPRERFGVLRDFAEFIHPKLARSETQQLGADGQPINPSAYVICAQPTAQTAEEWLKGKS